MHLKDFNLDVNSMIAPRSPTRGPRLYVAITLALVFVLLWNDARYFTAGFLPTFGISITFQRTLRVAVLETKGCHDEVTASFFSALGQMKETQVDAYLSARRFGIDRIYDRLPGRDGRQIISKTHFQPANFQNAETGPDVIISITSEFDLVEPGTAMTMEHLHNSTNAVLLAVVHHPDDLSWRYFHAVKPWIVSQRIRFITLSDHVTDWMIGHAVAKWATKVDISRVPVSTFPPVFVISEMELNRTLAPDGGKLRFTVQGDLVMGRGPNRDYAGTFQQFGEMMHDNANLPVELTVIGEGGLPQVPDGAKGMINFERSLPYPEFYGIMHFSTALLPALASHDYLDRKASSTVPASLIAGSPLIADQKILKAYTYLDEDDVYLRETDESEIDVVARLASLPEEVRNDKGARLRMKNERLTVETMALLKSWIEQSLQVGRQRQPLRQQQS
ncbi:hypothetical protein NA57DRAFT_58866 [Rhizodiscina lignyota]|uniref:Uncharacterized protein n=1 Tax=Rhizodiscina lignyota TaxID=1504668 RepID=A0A9P4I974_9PEZI|nr:hypothetical protein NA57DRAFT_58866 [Rhizodiscina lignyota]